MTLGQGTFLRLVYIGKVSLAKMVTIGTVALLALAPWDVMLPEEPRQVQLLLILFAYLQ